MAPRATPAWPSTAIGRANLDGSGVDPNFIPTTTRICTVAVDSAHIYWSNYQTGVIGRASHNGSGVNQSFLTPPGGAGAITVDGGRIYWINVAQNAIGRASVDGSAVNPALVTGLATASFIAADATHVYWTDSGPVGSSSTSIARAHLDGSNVIQSFVLSPFNPFGLTVDGLGSPVLQQTAAVQPVSGRVLVELPGAHRFTLLRAGDLVPVGSLVNTTSGRVRVVTVLPDGSTQTSDFYGGTFRLKQAASGMTTLVLVGGVRKACAAVSAAARGHGRTVLVRHLWGEGSGLFSTQGRYASATIQAPPGSPPTSATERSYA